jgi:hypothetical protein
MLGKTSEKMEEYNFIISIIGLNKSKPGKDAKCENLCIGINYQITCSPYHIPTDACAIL